MYRILTLVGFLVLNLAAQVDNDIPSWINTISDVGLVIFLVIVMYGAIKSPPWWVSYRELKKAEEREELYRQIAFRSLSASEHAASALGKSINKEIGEDP